MRGDIKLGVRSNLIAAGAAGAAVALAFLLWAIRVLATPSSPPLSSRWSCTLFSRRRLRTPIPRRDGSGDQEAARITDGDGGRRTWRGLRASAER